MGVAANNNLNSYLGNNKVVRSNDFSLKIQGEKKNNYIIKMRNLGKGQLFGHEDVINKRNYTFEVKCISKTAELFSIKAAEFINRFSRDE